MYIYQEIYFKEWVPVIVEASKWGRLAGWKLRQESVLQS